MKKKVASPIISQITFGSRTNKYNTEIIYKTIIDKNEIDIKRDPKRSSNRCPNSTKINAKTGTEKDSETLKVTAFPMGKIV